MPVIVVAIIIVPSYWNKCCAFLNMLVLHTGNFMLKYF